MNANGANMLGMQLLMGGAMVVQIAIFVYAVAVLIVNR